MKQIIFHFTLLLFPLLASAQQSEITDVTKTIVQDGARYFVLTNIKYANGEEDPFKRLIGDRNALLTYLQTDAVNRQQDIASVMKIALEQETLSFREFKGVDTLVTNVTGDTSLFDLNADSYFQGLQGRYRLKNSSGAVDLFFNLIRLANGGVRLEQEITLTRYTVQILSPHNFRILNLPIGAIPAATYPCYELNPAANGNRVFSDNIKIFRLTKVQ